MKFNNWKIGYRLALLAGILSIFLVITGLLGLNNLQKVNTSLQSVYQDRVIPLTRLKVVSDMYAVNIVDLSHKIRSKQFDWETALQALKNAQKRIGMEWEAYLATANAPEEQDLVRQARDLMTHADKTIEHLQTIIAEKQESKLIDFIEHNLYQEIDPITAQIGKLIDVQLDMARQEYEKGQMIYRETYLVSISCMVLALLLAGVLAYVIIRGVTRPVARTVEMVEALEQGNLDMRLGLERKDEIGRLARAMDAFADNLKSEVLEAFKNLAAGNFTFKAKGLIAQPLARANESLCRLVREIQNTSGQLAAGSEQVAAASQSLSQGATQSASSLEEISAGMTELASQSRQNADNAKQANGISGQAKEAADTGNQLMNDLMQAMFEINQSATNINKIIKVIDDIAFQTNLLALNAAVEAARAGQHGKGFAVVAEEVRNLAARSAKAAKETEELIAGANHKTTEGTELARNTAAALQRIVEESGRVTDLLNEISAASDEQAVGFGQVTQGLDQIEQVTQEATANAEESASAAEQLAGRSAQLREMLSRFKIGGTEQPTTSQLPERKPARPARAPALPQPTRPAANTATRPAIESKPRPAAKASPKALPESAMARPAIKQRPTGNKSATPDREAPARPEVQAKPEQVRPEQIIALDDNEFGRY